MDHFSGTFSDLFSNAWGNQQQQHNQATSSPKSYTVEQLDQILNDPNIMLQDPQGIAVSLKRVLIEAQEQYANAVREGEEGKEEIREQGRALESELALARHEITQLNGRLNTARVRLSQAQAVAQPPPSHSPVMTNSVMRSPAHPNPKPFGGTRRTPEDLKSWVVELNIKLRTNRDWWDNEVDRMGFVLSSLEGDALRQFHPYLNDDATFRGSIDSVAKMIELLQRAYGNTYSASDSWASLKKEKQGQRSTNEFLASFQSLAAAAGETGYPVVDILLENVHPAIKRGILTDREFNDKVSFETLVDMVRRQDQILRRSYGANFVKTKNPETSHTLPTTTAIPTALRLPSVTDEDSGDPMDLSVIQTGGKLVWTKKNVDEKRRALTPEEKAARKAYQILHGLCCFCDSPHHKIMSCPILKAKETKKDKDRGGEEEKDKGKA